MPPAVLLGLIFKVADKVFGGAKKISATCKDELSLVADIVSKFGIKRLKEIVFALPVFVAFVKELVRRRDQLQAQNRLYVIGAGAALSSLLAVIAGGLVTALPFQVVFFFAHPALALIFLTSGGTVIAAAIAVIVWLTIYVLTLVMQDDPIFKEVYARFVAADVDKMFSEVSAEIQAKGGDLDHLTAYVREGLRERGKAARPKAVVRRLSAWNKAAKPSIRVKRKAKAKTMSPA